MRGVGSALALLAVALLATGCLRTQIAAAVRADDTVTGELVVATVAADQNDAGAVLAPPAGLESRVRAQPYRQDGYAGTRLLFDGLSFEEFGRLAELAGGERGRLRMQLRRAGDLVLLSGRVNLVQVASPEKVDVAVRLSFPGRIAATNGQQSGNEVSWRPQAGQDTELTATVRYADPAVLPWTRWVLMVGGMVGFVVLTVLGLAYLAHRRASRVAD